MNKIFAYGSLMNDNDLRRTVPDAKNIFPVKLHGYRRVFNLESTYRFDSVTGIPICALNLETVSSSDFVNGTCFDMDHDSFDSLLEREKAYDLVEETVYDYFDNNTKYKALFFMSTRNNNYPYQIKSELQADYLKICVESCYKYGEDFLDEFKRSTHFLGIDNTQYEKLIWSRL